MHILSRHWRMRARIGWIACLAILFNALVPLVSQAMQAAGPAPTLMQMEVCTAMGMKTMPVVLSATPSDAGDASSGKLQKGIAHCGLCVFHAAAYGLPPPMGAGFVAAAGRDAFPPLHYQSSRPLFPWSLAQPRAPPRLS
ncbi:DUF2946 domain-containing protein [Massilia sp. LXY-6]|uniref:DUF2946 domain-containing protein n=1 Tax=Massilia sp. LXY-6 TaxID=3379823 RepID=UPI003EE325C1